MQANAVISADRRYVRITAVPFFSTIKKVVQYNLQSGVTDQAESDQAFTNADLNVADGGDGGGDADGGGGTTESILVSVPSPISVGANPNSGVVTRTGATTEALAVTLGGTNAATATLPLTAVTIPAGQSSQLFDITGVAAGTTAVTATGGGVTASSIITVQ